MASVERQDAAAVPLGARGDEGVGRTKREIVVPRHELTHARDVPLAAVELQHSDLQVAENGVDGADPVPPLCEVADLAQSRSRQQERPLLAPDRLDDVLIPRRPGVEPLEHRRRFDGQPCQRLYRSSKIAASSSSIISASNEPSATIPIELGSCESFAPP